MKSFNYNRKFVNDKKLYSVKDILEDFSKYMGIDFELFKKRFSDYEVVDFSCIEEYIKENEVKMWENRYGINKDVNKIIECRKKDYDYLKEQLAIISHKALNYMMLLEYIASNNNVFLEDKWFEMILERLEIYHFSRVMIGETINDLLGSLNNINIKFLGVLEQVNCLDTYHRQILCDLFVYFNESKMMSAMDCVVFSEDEYFDKTSLRRSRVKK